MIYIVIVCLRRAYSRLQYDVLVFCHQHELIDLTQPSLSLSTSNRPFMIDVIRTEKYELLHGILQSSPEIDQTACAQKLLTKVYEYGFGSLGQWKESLLSYACRAYTNDNHNILPSLLSPQTLGCHLSHIKIENVDLDHVPLPIFSAKLSHLELSKNKLATLPIAEALSRGFCNSLQVLNIASNSFSHVPKEFLHLPSLTKLDARNNEITTLPEDMWTAPCLEELYLCRNSISSLPCPNYVRLNIPMLTPAHRPVAFSLSSPNFSNNGMQQIPSARQAYLTAATRDAEALMRGFQLKILDLSNNQLSQIPRGLPCLAPQLRVLKLSNNRITHLGHPCNYPQFLENLDVSKNGCEMCIQWCSEPPNLVCAQSQLGSVQHEHSTCTHISHTVLSSLKFLYLQDNQLPCVVLEGQGEQEGRGQWREGKQVGGREEHEGWESVGGGRGKGGEEISAGVPLMFPKLQSLRLSNNILGEVPSGVHRQVDMCELTLDNNEGITHLPSNLHLLGELFFFTFDGISDPVVSELRNCSNTPEQLLYLKAREKKSVNIHMDRSIVQYHM